MKNSITPNESILSSAQQFYTSADILWKQPPEAGVMLPVIICATLAIELMLKSLNAKNELSNSKNHPVGNSMVIVSGEYITTATKEHKFSKLIDQIPKQMIEKVNTALLEKCNSNMEILKQKLSVFDNTFVTYRYIYERNVEAINIQELIDCSSTLMIAIKSVSKDIHQGCINNYKAGDNGTIE